MPRRLVGGIYVVEAKKDGLTEHWAAATLWENAVAAVEKELGPEWIVTLTDRRLASVISGQRARISRRLRGATSTPVRLLPSPRSRTAHARAHIAMPNALGSCCSYCPDSAR